MSRVLILHISQFGGHKKASENIAEALRYRAADIKVREVNGFGYITPRTEKVVNFFYTQTIKHFPALWGSLYDRKGVVRGLNPLHRFANRVGMFRISRLLFEYKPEVIVATQAFPCGIIADFKKYHNVTIPLIAVVTDYYPHRFWIHPAVDIYIVACEEARSKLIKEGVPEEKIKVLGIPISVKFLTAHSREIIAAELAFRSDIPTVLLMGGGLGIGPIEEIARVLDRLDGFFQVIVVCGRNTALRKWLEKEQDSFRKKFFIFGYIDFVNKLMDFADIIVTKSGGLTVSEALAKGMATIVVNPIPGQEELNASYLEKKKAVVRARQTGDVARCLDELLLYRKELVCQKENATRQAIVDSSLRIANVVLKFLQ